MSSNLLFLIKLLMYPSKHINQQALKNNIQPLAASGQWFMGNKKALFSDGICIKMQPFACLSVKDMHVVQKKSWTLSLQ